MRKATVDENKRCPKCRAIEKQAEIKQAAITYYSGVIGCSVAHLFHMNKANDYNWFITSAITY